MDQGRTITGCTYWSQCVQWSLWGLTILGLFCFGARPAAAQSNNDDRLDTVDKLLRGLIEAELNKRDVPRTAVRTTNNTTRPGTLATSAELVKAQKILDNVSLEANRLTHTLNDEQKRNASIRPLMSDVLKSRARAAVLAQRSSRVTDPEELRTDLQNLDRDWRVLAYRLGRVRNLSTTAKGSITQLNEYEKQLRDMFNVPPQLNNRELFQQTASLTAGVNSLLDDIDIELNQSTEKTALLLEGRRVQQQAHHVMDLVAEQDEYTEITKQYRQFQQQWNPFAARLRPYQNDYLERGVRRVAAIDNDMHELLFLPQQVDRQRLLHLTDVLRREVDTFFTRAPLKLLIDLPDSASVLPTADEFYGVCENFIDCVQRGENHDNLIGCFSYIEDSWRNFDRQFRPIKSDAAQHVISEIEHSIVALREALMVQEGFDRKVAADLAAALENLAEHLDADTQIWLNRERPNFRTQAARESASFSTAAHRFHENVQRGQDIGQLRAEVSDLYEHWRRVYGYVSKCESQDRVHLGRIASRITPSLVELRTLFAM